MNGLFSWPARGRGRAGRLDDHWTIEIQSSSNKNKHFGRLNDFASRARARKALLPLSKIGAIEKENKTTTYFRKYHPIVQSN